MFIDIPVDWDFDSRLLLIPDKSGLTQEDPRGDATPITVQDSLEAAVPGGDDRSVAATPEAPPKILPGGMTVRQAQWSPCFSVQFADDFLAVHFRTRLM